MADRATLWKAVRIVLAVGLVGAAAVSLARNWQDFSRQPVDLDLQAGWLLAAAAAVLGSYAALIECWRRVIAALGGRISRTRTAQIWLISALGRYVPGKVWTLSVTGVLARQCGVPATTAIASVLLMQVYSLLSGVVVVGLAAPAVAQDFLPAATFRLAGLAALGALGFLAACASPTFATRAARFLPARAAALLPVPWRIQATLLVLNAAAWIGYGFAFQWLGRGLSPGIEVPWAVAVSVFTVAYIVGLLALFAPGGIGPRDSMILLGISGLLDPPTAAALTVGSRILFTAVEVVAALVALATFPHRRLPPPEPRGEAAAP